MFKGSIPALVTPMRNGSLDEEAFRAFVDWQIAEGSHGLVPVGTTGESPTLSHEEHRRVVEICIEAAAKRVPVIAGAGSNSTREAIELAVHAEKAGADAVLVVTPYYNKPSQRGLYAHFRAVADAIKIPAHHLQHPAALGHRHERRRRWASCFAIARTSSASRTRRPTSRARACSARRWARISCSFPARTSRRSASWRMAGTAASRSRRMSRRSSARSSRRRASPATFRRRSTTRTG